MQSSSNPAELDYYTFLQMQQAQQPTGPADLPQQQFFPATIPTAPSQAPSSSSGPSLSPAGGLPLARSAHDLLSGTGTSVGNVGPGDNLALANGMALNAVELPLYRQLWNYTNPAGHSVLDGRTAADFFNRSGLSRESLYLVWCIADANDDGVLTFESFCAACRLVAHAQNGLPLTPALVLQEPYCIPVFNLKGYFSGSTPTPSECGSAISGISAIDDTQGGGQFQDPFELSSELQARYLKLLSSVPTDLQGCVTGPVARPLFTKSGLSSADLAKIWALCDRDADGRLTPMEFVAAMHIVTVVRSGMAPLPQTLPPPLAVLLSQFSQSRSPSRPPSTGRDDYKSAELRAAETTASTTHGDEGFELPPETKHYDLAQCKFGEIVQRNMLSDLSAQEKARRDKLRELSLIGEKLRDASSNRQLVRDAIQADRILGEELAQDVDALADEMDSHKTVGIALRTELARCKEELQKQRERKLDFEREVQKLRRELEQLQIARREVEIQQVGLTRDVDHYQNEIIFLQGQRDELAADLSSLKEAKVALEKNLVAVDKETRQLNEARLSTKSQNDAERGLLRQQEEQIREIRKHIAHMRREKADYQAKYAVLQERLRQADQDRHLHMQSLESERVTLAALHADRLSLSEEKAELANMLLALDQKWESAKQSGNNAGGAAPATLATAAAAAGLPRDSKGVPTTASSSPLCVFASAQPPPAERPWEAFGEGASLGGGPGAAAASLVVERRGVHRRSSGGADDGSPHRSSSAAATPSFGGRSSAALPEKLLML